ncbi:MAG: universal stress protein [Desulfovermiculus sp.]
MESSAHTVTGGERILVALDGSVPSEQALEKAISLAHKCQGKIFLIRVLEMPEEKENAEKHSRIFEDLQASLNQVKQGVESRGLECAATVSRGPEIAARIVQEAKDKDIDLVAMGTHGWTGQTAIAAMGSVARKVLCTSPCPVLIIPPKMGKDKQAECSQS